MQHDILAEEDEISEHHEDDFDDITEEVKEDNDDESSNDESEDNDKCNDRGNEDCVAVENRIDEVMVVEEVTAQPACKGNTTRSDCLSKL